MDEEPLHEISPGFPNHGFSGRQREELTPRPVGNAVNCHSLAAQTLETLAKEETRVPKISATLFHDEIHQASTAAAYQIVNEVSRDSGGLISCLAGPRYFRKRC